MAHHGESDPFAGLPANVKSAMFDMACDQGLTGEALVTEYHRLLQLRIPRPLADLALAHMQTTEAERLAGLIPLEPNTSDEHAITTALFDDTESA